MDERKIKIRTFLSRHVRGVEVHDEDDIFARGFVNSLLATQMVVFIEGEFDIAFENEDLVRENFASINAMAALIARKRPSTTSHSIEP